MKHCLIMMALAACFAFGSCGKSHEFDTSVKQLDSLKVVVEQALGNFSQLDSVSYTEAFAKQVTYSAFVRSHVQDTITGPEATALQEFYTAGKTFKGFVETKRSLADEAETSASQLKKLSQDLANDAVASRDAIGYINEEKKEAEKIIGLLKVNTEVLRKQMEIFNHVLPDVETLVKRYNSGVLPPAIKPEI